MANKINIFKLSNKSIKFISDYALNELKINSPITEELLESIIDYACNCEINTIDSNGEKRNENYETKERDLKAELFVRELLKWDDDKCIPDLDDLNLKLKIK